MPDQTNPFDLHVVTFDFEGRRIDTGEEKPFRRTGIVRHTHALIDALDDSIGRLALTQTSAPSADVYHIELSHGRVALAQGIQTIFPKDPGRLARSDETRPLVRRYYEEEINDPENPLLRSLAEQITHAIRRANIPNLICQNANSAVSLLKAEEFDLLDAFTASTMSAIIVIHDTADYEQRIGYLRDAMDKSRMRLKIVAVSSQVAEALRQLELDNVTIVSNGIDIETFQERLGIVQTDSSIFEVVLERNQVPTNKPLIVVAARRAPHKGHRDVIEACRLLRDQGNHDFTVVFTGATDAPEFSRYEQDLAATINRLDLQRRVFLLDSLTDLEMLAVYDRAYAAILASTEPEGFAYANIEAMLARTPVIATRLGGPLSYIEHDKTGLLVKPNCPQEIADALQKLLDQDHEGRNRLCRDARARARQFTTQTMADGYERILRAGRPSIARRVNLGTAFSLVGEGTNAYTFARNDRSVVQTFKTSHLTVDQLRSEYRYLKEAYRNIPCLIPQQRFCRQEASAPLTEALLVKDRVHVDRSRRPLHLVPNPGEELCAQMRRFLGITRELFWTAIGPDVERLYCVPDIIDPRFRNLCVDEDGFIRLVDTNWLMSTRSLQLMVANGDKLDIEKRPKIAMLLRRLMFLEHRFCNRSMSALQADPFFTQYLSPDGFAKLFGHDFIIKFKNSDVNDEPFQR